MRNKKEISKYEEAVRKRIKEIAKEQKLTNAFIAKRLFLSPSTVCRVLTEEGATVTLEFIESFANAFCGGDVLFLLTGETVISSYHRKKMFGNLSKEQQKEMIEIYSILGEKIQKLNIT